MRYTRAEMKAELLAKAEATIEEFLDWLEEAPAPTLTQIEDATLRFRQRRGQDMAETAVQAQETIQTIPEPKCPHCGQVMRLKAHKKKRVTTRLGELQFKRTQYYCPRCRKGLFPPRRTTPSLGSHV